MSLSDGLPFEASLAEAKNGGDEVGSFEDLEIPLGGVVALGAVDDGLGGGVPGDLLEGKWVAEEVFREALAPGMIVGPDQLFRSGMDVKAGVFPGEEVGEFLRTDEFGLAEGVEEAVAEQVDGWSKVFGGHAVEAAIGSKEAIGGEDMQVWMAAIAPSLPSGRSRRRRK
ncbi:MAG: hypothetical protein WBG04_02550 [Haloferula sp.]